MAIPGITDTVRLPRLGKVRLGKKKISRGKEYPAALDHFNFVDVPELAALFGENCREMGPILIPSDEEETWLRTSRTAYTKSGVFCRSVDGYEADRTWMGMDDKGKPRDTQGYRYLQETEQEMPEDGSRFSMPCPGEECHIFKRDRCKNHARFFFMVVDSPVLGCYEISTTSINSMLNLQSMARWIRSQVGRITGVPLYLQLVPQQVQPEGKAKTVFVLQLQYRGPENTSALRSLMSGRPMLGTGDPEHPNIEAPEQPIEGVPDAPDDVPDDLVPEGGAALERDLGLDGDDDDLPFGPEPLDIEGDSPADEKMRERVKQAAAKGADRAEGRPERPQKRRSRPKPQGPAKSENAQQEPNAPAEAPQEPPAAPVDDDDSMFSF